MLKNKFLFSLFIFLLLPTMAFADGAKKVKAAQDFVAKTLIKKANTKLLSQTQRSFLKKTTLVRVQELGAAELPAWLVAVGEDLKPHLLPLSSDLITFTRELNPMLKEENTALKNPEQAKNYLRQILGIYGIYEAKIECVQDHKKAWFLCQVNKALPREFSGAISISLDGLIGQVK